MSDNLLLAGVLWPLLCTCLFAFRATTPLALTLAPWGALPALAAGFLAGQGEVRMSFLLLGSELGLDATGQSFLLSTALLWLLAGVFARGYFGQSDRQPCFYALFLLTMAGNLLLVISLDGLSFYLGFALMSFAAYGLVIFDSNAAAFRAGRVYILLVVLGEAMILVALLLAAKTAGSTSFAAIRDSLGTAETGPLVIALALVGFGIKAGLLGLHVWMPLAYTSAPIPASAVLAGAMINAGLLGWVHLLPLGENAFPVAASVFLILGLVTAFYGVAVGLFQRNPKTVLAYSSMSQMGIMSAAIGVGLIAPSAWALLLPAVVFYAVNHGLSKGTLFLGLGFADNDFRMRWRWAWIALWLPALSLAGAPFTSGMLAKSQMKAQFLQAPEPWEAALHVLIPVSSLATAILMARLLYLVRPVPDAQSASPAWALAWPWFLALVSVAFSAWWFVPQMPLLDMKAIMDTLWPVLASAAIALIVLRWGLFRGAPSIPAGDNLIWVESGLEALCRAWRQQLAVISSQKLAFQRLSARVPVLAEAASAALGRTEARLTRWRVAAQLVILIILAASLMASPVWTSLR
ncbi:complex I subunit 5 family protein [Rhodomicrobium vannielii]|nr:complex I subunit 5 family protein [Rhodomicrobium vannielii]